MFDIVADTPALLKVLGSLGLILVINLTGVPLIIAVVAGTLALALWCGFGPAAILHIAVERFFSFDTLLLAAAIFLVISLSSQMEASGVMRDLVAALCRRFSRRASMALLPAVIGFLPMPGGALFSAPLVDRCDADGAIRPLLKTQINYWFRHVWEFWWPLYPGVLLAMQYTQLKVWQVILLGLPLTLASFAAGYLFMLRRLPPDEPIPHEGEHLSLRALLLPIGVIIACYALVQLLYAGLQRLRPGLPELDNFVPMVIGVCIAMLVQQRTRPLPRETWRKILLSTKTLQMVLIVLALFVYGGFINAQQPDGSHLMASVKLDLDRWGIPLMAVKMVIPFISGLTFGVAFGFVGASFPIVISLLGAHPAPGDLLSTAVLAYGCGYLGMMLSPVHVCGIVSCQHFGASLFRSLAGLLKPAAVVLVAVVGMYLAVRWLVG